MDRALVEAIYDDRKLAGFSRTFAEDRARDYASWLRELEAGTASRRYLEGEVDRLLGFLQRQGRLSAVYGPQGKGKTNLSAFVTEIVLACRPDWQVLSNVPYPWYAGKGKAPPRLKLVESDVDLLRALSENILAEKWPTAVVLDEFDQAVTSHTWSTDISKSWNKFVNVKRHYLAMGPLLVYHALNQIPLEARSSSTGSVFKLIVRDGEHALIDLEDDTLSTWASTIDRSALPYLTHGLRGFSLSVDFGALQDRLRGPSFRGDPRSVAEETLAFLDEWEAEQRAEADEAAAEARHAHAAAIMKLDNAVAEQHEAALERREQIIRAFMEDPNLTNRAACARFRASPKYVVDLREIALRRLAAGSPAPGVSLPASEVPG